MATTLLLALLVSVAVVVPPLGKLVAALVRRPEPTTDVSAGLLTCWGSKYKYKYKYKYKNLLGKETACVAV